MIDTTHLYHHPYKPKQRFTHYIKTPNSQNICNGNETTCHNAEEDQPLPTTVIHHHHYLSQSTSNLSETAHQNNEKDDCRSSPLSSATAVNIIARSAQLHDVARSKSSPRSPPTAIKTELNFEEKLFSESTNNTLATLIKTNGGKISGSMTINVPCLVCGDEASGFHYGVNSCEGCKVSLSSFCFIKIVYSHNFNIGFFSSMYNSRNVSSL